jgi:hypothetical protein
LLSDEEWGQWPETKLAEQYKVSRFLVRTIIGEKPHLVEKQDTIRWVERNGSTYTMDPTKIGRSPTPQPVIPPSRPFSWETTTGHPTPHFSRLATNKIACKANAVAAMQRRMMRFSPGL